jgi:hypothetical protein
LVSDKWTEDLVLDAGAKADATLTEEARNTREVFIIGVNAVKEERLMR